MAFRFEQVGRNTQPSGFINFDRAIEILGKQTIPEWNKIIAYSPHPFIVRDGSQVRLKFGKPGKLNRNIRRSISTERPQRYSGLYKEIIQKISEAVQRGDLTLYCISHQGEIIPVPYRGIVVAQKMHIFYTGTVVLERQEEKSRWRVLVSDEEFSTWVKRPDRPVLRESKPTGWSIFINRLPALRVHVLLKKYRLTKASFFNLMMDIAPELSKSGFERIWLHGELDDIKKRGRGRPSAEDQREFEADKESLISLMRSPVISSDSNLQHGDSNAGNNSSAK